VSEYIESVKATASSLRDELRKNPSAALKRMCGLMASIVAGLIGIAFVGIGSWILFMRVEGWADWLRPDSLSIGHMTVDGEENHSYAELLRARFDHHFRRTESIPIKAGFLELASLDVPELFRSDKKSESALAKMNVDVSGVDVIKVVQFFNQLVKPAEWTVEGDFQTQADRALLVLRLSRGDRVIRTWYLERTGTPNGGKSILIEQLIDSAIFQVVHDFGNADPKSDPDLGKWRKLVPLPVEFPSPAAVASYYEARGALARYYAHGAWADLDMALDRLLALRSEMPEYADGLQLLGLALAEKRNDTEAIHVYEQLRSILLPKDEDEGWKKLSAPDRRRVLSIDLLRATAETNLYGWPSTHQAVAHLLAAMTRLRSQPAADLSPGERAAHSELLAQTAVQLAYAYATYLELAQKYQVADMFGAADAPLELRVTDASDLAVLRGAAVPTGADDGKSIVRRVMRAAVREHQKWLDMALKEQEGLEPQWHELHDPDRRKAELVSRLQTVAGYTSYRMAEIEPSGTKQADTVFGKTFAERLQEAREALRKAHEAHPNHYFVLQLLGLTYSEPRDKAMDLSVAEQYFERAVRANPSDGYGHELLSGVLLRRAANVGVDQSARDLLKRGLGEAQEGVRLRDTSGDAHLLRAEFQAMLLELERTAANRKDLRATLQQYVEQAARFLPAPFENPNVDLLWVRVVDETRSLGDKGPGDAFAKSKGRLLDMIEQLVKGCEKIKERWVAQQRVFRVEALRKRAQWLGHDIGKATFQTVRDIRIPAD